MKAGKHIMPLWKNNGFVIKFFIAFSLLCALTFIGIYIYSKWLTSNYGKATGPNEYGDSFGGLNTIFSGLALAGIISALFLQISELHEIRQERTEANEALNGQLASMQMSSKIDLMNSYISGLKGDEAKKRIIAESIINYFTEVQFFSIENSKALTPNISIVVDPIGPQKFQLILTSNGQNLNIQKINSSKGIKPLFHNGHPLNNNTLAELEISDLNNINEFIELELVGEVISHEWLWKWEVRGSLSSGFDRNITCNLTKLSVADQESLDRLKRYSKKQFSF